MAIAEFMKRPFSRILGGLLLALMVLAGAPTSAEAQGVCVTSRGNCAAPYAGPGAQCFCHIPGFGRKAGNVQYGGGGYYAPRPVPRYEDDGYAPYPRRRPPMGSVCVTSRGDCSVGRPMPIGAGCKCMVPEFGVKRGNIRY